MGVLTTKEGPNYQGIPNYLHSYHFNTSQVIPFLRSIITFSVKRLLTPEGVTEEFSLTRGLFSGSVTYVYCRHKIKMASLIILRKLPTFGLRGLFPSANSFRSNRRIWFKLQFKILLATTYHPPSFSSLCSSVVEKRFPEVTGAFVYLGHKTGSGGLGGLGF